MENGKKKKVIKNFRDLEVYQRLYKAMIIVMTKIIPELLKEERFDLVDQMRRSCKATPAILAEGFAKRYQKKNWKKYLDDTMGECNEVIHHLSICLDVYNRFINVNLCQKLINEYDLVNRQLYRLRETWINFHENDK